MVIVLFTKFKSPSPKDASCKVWLKKKIVNVCCYFVAISPWKRRGPSFKQIWIPSLKDAKFGWNRLGGSGVEISSMYFRYFVIFSPWKRTQPFIWTNLNPNYPMMHYVEIGSVWKGKLKKKFYNFTIIISPWMRACSIIWTNLNFLYLMIIIPSLVEIGLVVLEKKMKMIQVS